MDASVGDSSNLPSTREVSKVTLAAFLLPAGRLIPIFSKLSRNDLPPFFDFALNTNALLLLYLLMYNKLHFLKWKITDSVIYETLQRVLHFRKKILNLKLNFVVNLCFEDSSNYQLLNLWLVESKILDFCNGIWTIIKLNVAFSLHSEPIKRLFCFYWICYMWLKSKSIKENGTIA